MKSKQVSAQVRFYTKVSDFDTGTYHEETLEDSMINESCKLEVWGFR